MKIALGWVYWTVYTLASLVVMVIGWPLLAVFAALRLWTLRPSLHPQWPGHVWAWRGGWLMALWSNEEDGIGGPRNTIPRPWPAWKWAAWRNSANGLRLLPGAVYTLPASPAVRYARGGYLATSGWRQCLVFSAFGAQWRLGWMIDDDAQKGWLSWPVLNRR